MNIYLYNKTANSYEKLISDFGMPSVLFDNYKNIINFNSKKVGKGNLLPLKGIPGNTDELVDITINDVWDSSKLLTLSLNKNIDKIQFIGEAPFINDYVLNNQFKLTDYEISAYDKSKNYISIFRWYSDVIFVADTYGSFSFLKDNLKLVSDVNYHYISGHYISNKKMYTFFKKIERSSGSILSIDYDYLPEIITQNNFFEFFDIYHNLEYGIIPTDGDKNIEFLKFKNKKLIMTEFLPAQDGFLFYKRSNSIIIDKYIYICDSYMSTETEIIRIKRLNTYDSVSEEPKFIEFDTNHVSDIIICNFNDNLCIFYYDEDLQRICQLYFNIEYFNLKEDIKIVADRVIFNFNSVFEFNNIKLECVVNDKINLFLKNEHHTLKFSQKVLKNDLQGENKFFESHSKEFGKIKNYKIKNNVFKGSEKEIDRSSKVLKLGSPYQYMNAENISLI